MVHEKSQAIRIRMITDNLEKRAIMAHCECAFIDTSRHTEGLVEKICKYAIFLASYSEDTPCGYVAFYANDSETKSAYITMIAVHPDFHRSGVGKLLLNAAIGISKQYGMTQLRLEVDLDNVGAIRFYQKNGLEIEGKAGENSQYMIVAI